MTVNPITITKCPNCGSTSQVRETDISQSGKEIIFSYSCGCGCKFTERYVKSNTRIYYREEK